MKKLFLLLFLITHPASAEDQMIPVAEYTAANTKWQSNLYEMLYVATRCGTVYLEAHRQIEDSTSAASKDLFKKSHTILLNTADYIDAMFEENEVDYLTQTLENEMNEIHAFYKQEVPISYKGNNTFEGLVEDDMNACESYFGFFEGLLREAV